MRLRSTVRKSLGAVLGEDRLRDWRGTVSRRLDGLADSVAPVGLVRGKARSAAPSRTDPKAHSGPKADAKPKADAQPKTQAKPAAVPKTAAKPAAPKAKPALGEPNDRRGGWIPSDPYVASPEAVMTRHDILRAVHEQVQPRTYLEIGVSNGQSLTLSRTRSIGVDPAFQVDRPLHCDLQLVRDKSDAFFERPDALAHFEGAALDLAFIDGMHLSEYALRDFMNLERHMDRAGIVLMDDVLPRNPLEAARNRLTSAWTGDVYKALEVLQRRRPDLLVLTINTAPTGTALVIGMDPDSDVLWDSYADELPYLTAEDPQSPPEAMMNRSVAVDPEALVRSPAWELLARARRSGDRSLVAEAMEALRSTPLAGAPA